MVNKSLTLIIQSYVFLQILSSLIDSVSLQQLSIPTCNHRLNGRSVTVHGLRWNSINIRLSTKTTESLGCPYGEGQAKFQILGSSQLNTLHEILSNEMNKFEFSANTSYFNKDGTFALVLNKSEHHYFGVKEYCITNANSAFMDIKYCQPSCNGSRPCIVKCCPYDEAFNPIKNDCESTEANVKWSPFLYPDVHASKPSNKSSPHYTYFLIPPKCPTVDLEASYSRAFVIGKHSIEKFPFKVLEDGSLSYITSRRRWEVQPKNDNDPFCLDAIQGYDAKINSSGLESEQILFNCAIAPEESNTSLVYITSMYVSSVFLILTCIVYLLLWDKQNVHGWTVFSLVVSMLCWYIFLGTAHLLGYVSQVASVNDHDDLSSNSIYSSNFTSDHSISTILEEHVNESYLEEDNFNDYVDSENDDDSETSSFCFINAILAHFFFLSTFTWLTFINLDLFLTFKTLASVVGRSKGFKKFATYASLSWGIPLIVVICGVILDYKYPDRESLVITPEYGKSYCFVTPGAQGVYIYYIITVLLTVNFIFVGTTFYFLYTVKKLTGSVRSSKTNDKHETFVLVVKLSVVMGVTWIFEVISWASTKDSDHTSWYWIIVDVYNLFQAFFIFVIFVCKKTIMAQLEQKYPIFKDIFIACGCSKLHSCLSTITRSAGLSKTENSSGNTHSTDNDSNWAKNSVALKPILNEKNSNESNFDEKVPSLKSFEKLDSRTSLLHRNGSPDS